jgi:rSAM/selenodomain-associated transferase 2
LRAKVASSGNISIIVPCWRDDSLSARLAEGWLEHGAVREVLIAVVDAEESSGTRDDLRIIPCSRPGRGHQMNEGARLATGDILLFQHADTEITDAHFENLRRAMDDPALAGGAFRRRFDERHPHLRWLEPWEALRCRRWGPLFGDQSIFVRRAVFEALHGFADIPLMEDVEFSCRLRRYGRVAVLDPAIRTSPRKHLQQGSWRTTVRNGLMLLLYVLGASPKRLHEWYYRPRGSQQRRH